MRKDRGDILAEQRKDRDAILATKKVITETKQEPPEQIDCRSFEKCSAPICPLDHPENAIWYKNESTCTKSPIPKWVKRQRRIAKKTNNPDDYFTLKILMSTGRTGINPEKREYGRPE